MDTIGRKDNGEGRGEVLAGGGSGDHSKQQHKRRAHARVINHNNPNFVFLACEKESRVPQPMTPQAVARADEREGQLRRQRRASLIC